MFRTKLILEKFDKDHRLLLKREKWSRSFLLQFIELLYVAHAQVASGAPYSMSDIGNNARDIDSDDYVAAGYRKHTLRMASPPGDAGVVIIAGSLESAAQDTIQDVEWNGEDLGIVIGTDNTPVTPSDYALGTIINHGDGAGEMEYGGCEFTAMVIADPNAQFTMRRYFTNNSGGGITVEEVGIYAAGTQYVTNDWGHAWPFCAARDLTGGVAVADTEILRVTYVPQITV